MSAPAAIPRIVARSYPAAANSVRAERRIRARVASDRRGGGTAVMSTSVGQQALTYNIAMFYRECQQLLASAALGAALSSGPPPAMLKGAADMEFMERPPGYRGPNLDPSGVRLRPKRLAQGVYALMATQPPRDNSGVIIGERGA